MNKNIKKSIVFLLIFFILLYCATKALWLPKTALSYFYKEPKNSLDIVYIGSSNAYVHFNTVLAYNLYGYTTGFLSTDTQPISLAKYMIEESEKYQKPSLYIIDLAKAVDELNTYSGEDIRKTIDSMKFSKNRIDAINETLKYKKDISKDEYINYYFSFLMYHNAWKNIYWNLLSYSRLYKGYLFSPRTNNIIESQTRYKWNKKIDEISKETQEIITDLINYIKSKKIDVLFVVPVRTYAEEINSKLNFVVKFIEKNDLKVINFNTLDDFDNIDFTTDFYNDAHLNIYGSTKYTLYFAKYLKENYELPDHRNDKRYNSWNAEYERFKKDFNETTNKNFDDLLGEYEN